MEYSRPKTPSVEKSENLKWRAPIYFQNIHGGVFDFTPITFILPNEYNKFVDAFTAEQREHAMARYQEEQENMAENKPKRRGIWICKPSDLSRGRKIFLLRSLKDLSYDCQMIAQRYIERPFLIGGYKWDLRIYVLMVGGVDLRFYLFKEGLVRFSTEKYTLGSFSNKFMHLTNSSINKYSPALHTVKNIVGSGAKWTFAALNKHLRVSWPDSRRMGWMTSHCGLGSETCSFWLWLEYSLKYPGIDWLHLVTITASSYLDSIFLLIKIWSHGYLRSMPPLRLQSMELWMSRLNLS